MSAPNDGGPAFPCSVEAGVIGAGCGPYVEWGMTLRDYFAAKALAGMLAHPDTKLDESHDLVEQMRIGPWAIADAMLAARNPQPKAP